MPAPRKYDDELRARAVRLVEQLLKENPGMAHKRACHDVGEQLGIPAATLATGSATLRGFTRDELAVGGPRRRGSRSWIRRTACCVARTRS